MHRKRILSGIQPSGNLHLGNYFGMMKRMIEYQETNELFCFLVNYHAITTITNSELLRQNTFKAACDFLALGLDPDKAIFWVQSDVPEVTELTWLLNNTTSVGLLERAHSYKDKIAKGFRPNHGLFSYPVLMAADILLFGGEAVPVGKDQKQHLEITRDIAIRFNKTFGETFIIPESLIENDTGLIPGIDGQKMSKSYKNTIEIFCEKDVLAKKVMSIVTNKTPINEAKETENSTLFQVYSLFLNDEDKKELEDRFRTPGLGYGKVKKELIEIIWNYFNPYRIKREKLLNDKSYVVKILKEGAEKARSVGKSFLELARKNVGLNYQE
ncbi:MAG: tryptophan--tRNA ligase [Candidatus Marinimicrobia bacterium]|nr:tryptophan--tRNA ligase [Candidatus Neomarinimicrobiota bacterium]